MKKLIWILAGIGACLTLVAARPDKSCLRLLYWNIQNGMWDGSLHPFHQVGQGAASRYLRFL